MIRKFNIASPSLDRYLQILDRRMSFEESKKRVELILKKVKTYGDKGILELTKKYNGVSLNKKTIAVSKKEIDCAVKKIPSHDKKLLLRLKKRLISFHKRIKPATSIFKEKGIILGELWAPIERVGIYIPAGLRPLVSSLLMTACPAKASGVKEIILTTPPSPKGKINPYILYTASILGIKEIYKVGGAQAIAAMAFGTETIPKVQKIAGPGNIYVTLAKKFLFGDAGIDLLAGPSEIVILADTTAPPEYVAIDLFSQAEHGRDSASILITTSRSLIKEVKKILKDVISQLPKDNPAKKSLRDYGSLIFTPSLKRGIDLVNEIAPEHLEIMVKKPNQILPLIKNAGAIFIGPYSPVSIGDYVAGPSHVLPTSGTACFSSGITTQTFMKSISLISSKKQGFSKLRTDALRMAEIEGLIAHKKAIDIRKI